MNYKVTVLKGDRNRYPNARLGISLGQAYHEGDKFKALCDWASSRFNSVEVMVADTLNRWNDIAEGNNVQDWRHIGDEWLERNRSALDLLPRKTITRWNDYRAHADYLDAHKWVVSQYDENSEFRNFIDEKTLAVQKKRGLSSGAKSQLRSYLIEEFAVFKIMEKNPVIDVYPGTFLPVRELLELNINPVRVDFLRLDKKQAA